MEFTIAGLSLLGIGFSSYKLKNITIEKPVKSIVKKLDNNYMEPDSVKNLDYIISKNIPENNLHNNTDLIDKYNDLICRRNEIRQLSKQPVFRCTRKNSCECNYFGVYDCHSTNHYTTTVYRDNVPITVCPNILNNPKIKFSLGELNGEIVHVMD